MDPFRFKRGGYCATGIFYQGVVPSSHIAVIQFKEALANGNGAFLQRDAALYSGTWLLALIVVTPQPDPLLQRRLAD